MTKKMKTGVDLDVDVVERLDMLVAECRDLQLSRSEAINAILDAFLFQSGLDDKKRLEKLRHLVIVKRKR